LGAPRRVLTFSSSAVIPMPLDMDSQMNKRQDKDKVDKLLQKILICMLEAKPTTQVHSPQPTRHGWMLFNNLELQALCLTTMRCRMRRNKEGRNHNTRNNKNIGFDGSTRFPRENSWQPLLNARCLATLNHCLCLNTTWDTLGATPQVFLSQHKKFPSLAGLSLPTIAGLYD
jgi:hypothetical protein